jgi:Fic family protein
MTAPLLNISSIKSKVEEELVALEMEYASLRAQQLTISDRMHILRPLILERRLLLNKSDRMIPMERKQGSIKAIKDWALKQNKEFSAKQCAEALDLRKNVMNANFHHLMKLGFLTRVSLGYYIVTPQKID